MDQNVTFYELNSKNRITTTGTGKKKKSQRLQLSKSLTSISVSGLSAHELAHRQGQLCMTLNSTGVLKL